MPQAISLRHQQLIHELFSDLPADFSARAARVQDIKEAIQSMLASSMQDSLNTYLAQQPQDTLSEQRELAWHLNEALRGLSLAIKCPRTNLPAILIVDTQDKDHADTGRFRLQVISEAGKRIRSLTSMELPLPFELMPAPARREGLAHGYAPPPTSRQR